MKNMQDVKVTLDNNWDNKHVSLISKNVLLQKSFCF